MNPTIENEIRELYALLREVNERLRVLEATEHAGGGTVIPPDPVARGDVLAADSDPKWGILTMGGAHYLLKVNAAGTDPAWEAYDWDALATASGADMVHNHQSAAEGAQLGVAALTDHNKATHDALNIDADTVDSLHAYAFLRANAADVGTGRIQWTGAATGDNYASAPIEIIQTYGAALVAPRISFHYAGAVASQIGFFKGDSSGDIAIIDNPGTGYEALRLRHLRLYSGTTNYGEITVDSAWMRLNQSLAPNIYTPRFLRADGGLAAGSVTPGAGQIRTTSHAYFGGSIIQSTALGCRVGRETAWTTPNSTLTVCSFTAEYEDTYSAWSSGSPTRLYAQAAGRWHIDWMAGYVGTTPAFRVAAIVRKNGTQYVAIDEVHIISGRTSTCCASVTLNMAAGDYLECMLFQDSGATKSAQVNVPASNWYHVCTASFWRVA
jgi:hypothetical protein